MQSLVNTPHVQLTPAVARALAKGQPVVAFETTVLSFGLPHPHNLTVAHRCEQIVRGLGCEPATLGMLGGVVFAGLEPSQVEEFCRPGAPITKVNLQNLAAAKVRGESGAFTVAASMQVSHAAGIRVFCTGGVGGVHQDFARLHDASSDLMALARYPVAVVSAGVKSILDVPATLEQLETLGVPVIGYKTDHFPLFHAASSAYPLEVYSDDMDEIAQMAHVHWQLGGRGVMVVTPIPERYAVDPNELQGWLDSAHRAAEHGRVSGKQLTPYLLKKLEELSHGRTLTSNVALLENNAVAAAGLAQALAKMPAV